jgi:hypothetical protein
LLRKILNTIVIAFQWGFSLLLAIYLIVPGYNFDKTAYTGNNYYNPYANWNDNPLTEIYAESNSLTTNNYLLFLSPLDFASPIYSLDTVVQKQMGKFFLGYSKNDIQYLISKYKRNNPGSTIVIKPKRLPSKDFVSYKGLNLMQLTDSSDVAYWDTLLNNGQPVFAYADAMSGFSKNLVDGTDITPFGILKALKNGRNLMVFSSRNLTDTNIVKLPVIRNIKWQQNTIHIDLSQPANIHIIASGFKLDTLAQALHLKFFDQDWFRFKVDFKKEGISYVSNPVFRYEGSTFEPPANKPDNLRSIFYNLAWLIGIVLLNFIINKFRRAFIYSRN